MKITTTLNALCLLTAVLGYGTASAYSPDESKKDCKKPHFSDFNLPLYNAANPVEVAPEAEFIVKISPYADSSTIKLTAKGEPVPFTLETTTSFHKVKAKVPAALSGQFVRINVSAAAALGCDDQSGWLIKVAGK
jgi:hypothetical protein